MLKKIFGVRKPVIGMLHLDYLLGSKEYKGMEYVVKRALKDVKAMERGGIDGIIIENWKEDSIGAFVAPETATSFALIAYEIAQKIHVPFGINVLNNDYKVALSVAKLTGASFVELDVFVDDVKSDFKFSPTASKHPFEIKVTPSEILSYAEQIGAGRMPLFVFVQPKHYSMINKQKTIEKSTQEAATGGAGAIAITKETGVAPTLSVLERAKKVAGKVPVGIGSGLNLDNVAEFMGLADFAIVGTGIKVDNDVDNEVDFGKVKALMKKARTLR